MSAIEGPWRCCDWPQCPARYDAVAVNSGDIDAWTPGWVMVLSTDHLCPEHAKSGHLPRRKGTTVTCECGWAGGEVGDTLGKLQERWQEHVAALAASDRGE